MAIEFLSIVIFTFSLALFILGAFTWWIEREQRRTLGALLMSAALVIAVGYAFLGSRFSIAVFGRLIVTVNLPRLMTTAIMYTIGVFVGFGLAGILFLWASGRLARPTRFEWLLAGLAGTILLIALAISLLAVQISR
jgi:hypothetical protein